MTHPKLGEVTLTNDHDGSSGVTYTSTLEDGYYLFTDIPARTGYRLKDENGLTLKKKIHLTPNETKNIDRELFHD
jgi:hypothetical protein